MMKNEFTNMARVIEIGLPSWNEARENGVLRLRADYDTAAKVRTAEGHRFINLCSCSYLGLDTHPRIIQSAIDALTSAGVLVLPTSRARLGLSIIDDAEAALKDLFRAECIVTISCSAASAGMLPCFASGVLTGDRKPVMIFDKNCHFSMNLMKPFCGDETEVHTCEHNDVEFIKSICQREKERPVVYVADGAYSMGGAAPVSALQELQDMYGLYLYFDDSHSLSLWGERGEGYVRAQYGELHERTVIVASLGKGFGASGGVVMLGMKDRRHHVEVLGGPMLWSQTVNSAGLGAIIGSAEVHRTPELRQRQDKLRENVRYFDSLCPTVNSGNDLPIRIIDFKTARSAIELSGAVYKRGYYTSAVFFPIVARGRAGLRVMPRADLSRQDIRSFCEYMTTLQDECSQTLQSAPMQ